MIKKKIAWFAGLLIVVLSVPTAFARIVFDSEFIQGDGGETVLIDGDGSGAADTQVQFGSDTILSENGVLRWDITNNEFILTNGSGGVERSNLSFEVETVSALPGAGAGLGAAGEGRLVILDTPDNTAPGCTVNPFCSAGTYIWDGGAWVSLVGAPTSTNLTKVVTVDPGGGSDYTDIETAAAYLQTRSGGIMLLSADVHPVTTAVDLTNVQIIGKDATRSTIAVSGAGQLDTFDTYISFVTMDINAITDTMAFDVQSGASSLIFEFVDINVQDSGDSIIDSNAVTAPTVTLKFIKSNATGGAGTVLKAIGSGNLNAASNIFIDSRSGDSPLDIQDWDVTLSGGGSVLTSGTIFSVPAQSIIVSPGMNLQGAIDSLEFVGNGGLITLLPGTHTITQTLTIEDDDIQIQGYGDSSVIRTSGTFVSTGSTIGAIQVGSLATPVSGVQLKDFMLEVDDQIHGIRVTGGADNRIDNVTVNKVSGASGSGDANADIGILMLDGTSQDLIRPVVTKCRVLGAVGVYFTDGIHITADGASPGVFGSGNRVRNALVDGNNVSDVGETAYVFVGVSDSSLFNNRAAAMGRAGGGAYGIYMGNIENVNMNANVFTGSLSTTAIGIGIESFNLGSLKTTVNSVIVNNVVDGFADGGVGFATGFQIGNATNTAVLRNLFNNNTVTGAVPGASVAFVVRGNADSNSISFNNIAGGTNPWDTGVDIQSATADFNVLLSNRETNVTVPISDASATTVNDTNHHRATSNPTVNDDVADGYDVGTIWINTTADDAYILLDSTAGAAIWAQIDGGSASLILDDAYNNDTGERTVTVDAGDISWDITAANQFVVDLQGTGDFIIQDAGVTFATFTDGGDFNLTNNLTVGAASETISNGSFVLNGDDVFISDSLGVEGQIYTDATNTKYFFLDINGGVSNSVTVGNKISGLVPVMRLDAAGNSEIRWTFPVPDDWQSGTDIIVTVFWSPSNTNTNNVQWDINYASVPVTDTLTAGDFTNLTPTEAANGTTDQVQTESFTIPSGVLAVDEMVLFYLNRDGGAGTDTYTGNVDIHLVRVQYTGKKLL